MVARLGGTPVCAPAVRERPTEDDARPIIARLVAGEFRVVVALTGAGVTALFAQAESMHQLDEVRAALARMMIVSRGPKPQAALKRYGLTPQLVTAKPHTSHELLEMLADTDLDRVAVLLLHYGERNQALAEALAGRGAMVDEVCLYEWALPEDLAPIHDVVQRLIAKEIDALLVTSQVQFRFLMEIAAEAGLDVPLLQVLNDHVIVGAVGPVCAAAIRVYGVIPDVLPESPSSPFLVGALADYFELTNFSDSGA